MADRSGVDTGGFDGGRAGGGALKVFTWIGGIGCLAAILLVATCVGGAGYLFQSARTGTTDVVEPFFEDLDSGRWERAYDRIGDGWRERMDLDAFRAEFEPLRDRLGALQDLDIRGLRAETDVPMREIRYLATFDRGEARITVRLEADDDGVERIEGLRMDLRTDPGTLDEDPLRLPGVSVIEGSAAGPEPDGEPEDDREPRP